jgi:heme exporter protein D
VDDASREAEPDAGRAEHAPPERHAAAEAPASARFGWSALMVAAVLAIATIAAVASRGLMGGFGLGAAGAVTVVAATLATGLALLPMAAIIELPRAMWGHWVPERRHRAGRCPACGYGGSGGRCPECGAAFERPPSYAADWATLRRVAWTVVPASLAAAALGLVISVADERAFLREVDAERRRDPALRTWSRPRAWPAGFAELRWDAGRGCSGPPPFDAPKEALRPRA